MKMNFKTALINVCRMLNSDGVPNDPFFVYSRMADMIGDSYEDKKKLSLFFAVEKRVDLLQCLSELPGEQFESVREQYPSVSDLLDESAFNRLIDLLIEVINSVKITENKPIDDKADEDKPACADDKSACAGENVCDGEVNKPVERAADEKKNNGADEIKQSDTTANAQADTEKNKPSNGVNNSENVQKTNVNAYAGSGGVAFGFIMLLLSVATLIFCGIFGVKWRTYQWIVGISAAVILVICYFSAAYVIDEYAFDSVALGIAVAVNFVLLCVFKGKYNIVCYWISGAILVLDIYAMVKAFDDYEPTFGIADIVECVLTIGIILLNIFL